MSLNNVVSGGGECCPNPCGVAIVVVIILLLIAMSVLC